MNRLFLFDLQSGIGICRRRTPIPHKVMFRSCEVRSALMAAICVEDYPIEGPEPYWVEVDCLACRMFVCRETACHFRRHVTFIDVIQNGVRLGQACIVLCHSHAALKTGSGYDE